MENINTGVIEDPRTPEEKAKDFQHSELAGAVKINWVEKDPSTWRKYSIRNQDGSLSCVAQACAKALETNTGEVESAHPIYRSRSNYPSGGMWLQDAGNIVVKIGTTSEQADPSQNMGENQINTDIKVPSTVRSKMYISVNIQNIDQLAEAVEIAKHCPIIINGYWQEWTDVPTVMPGTEPFNFGHGICIVDYTLWKGKKAVVIDDSWGKVTTLGSGGQRVLTEDYLKARGTDAIYFIQIAPTDQKPKHTFSKFLTYGMTNDPDVKALQQILAYEGLFPANLDTGNYFNITASAVLKWQLKHNVASLAELNGLKGRRCGIKTIAMLNSLYN